MDIDDNIRDMARLQGHADSLSDTEVGEIRTVVSNGFIDDQLDKGWSDLSQPQAAE